MTAPHVDLPKTMRSVICYGPEDYRLEEIAVPTVSPGEVLVRILGAGICAGDAKCYSGAPLFWGDEDRQGYCQPPITPGHEFVGEVVALGEGAAEKYGLEIGNLAISEQIVPCWQCRFCLRGQYWMWPSICASPPTPSTTAFLTRSRSGRRSISSRWPAPSTLCSEAR